MSENNETIDKIYGRNPKGRPLFAEIIKPLRVMWMEWKQFLAEYRNLLWMFLFFVLIVYGIRIIHDNIFLDSEIMMLRPKSINSLWLGSSRFGLVFTRRLFGLNRLIPYLSGGLMAFTMYCTGIFLSYCIYSWSGHRREYHFFHYLFPMLFVSAPIFAEHFLFLLQAFEISFGILVCLAASFCISCWARRQGPVWLFIGLIFMVWGFGSYQAMFPLYLSLASLGFVICYINGNMENAVSCGMRHMLAFLLGCFLYMVLAKVTKYAVGADSAYISDMVHWKKDGLRVCLYRVKSELARVLRGKPPFFNKIYLPAMCLFVLQMVRRGWRRKKGTWDYVAFLFSAGLLVLSPFFLNLVSGNIQMIRAHLVYPVVSALFLAHLTVWSKEVYASKRWKILAVIFLQAVCIFTAERNAVCTVQIFQNAWEAYRNDVLTANRMYTDIAMAAGNTDISECMVIFVGKRDAGLAGLDLPEELSGLSFFEAEADTSLGVSGRVGSLFLILGMDMKVMGTEDGMIYQQAITFMEDAPNWPSLGSVKKMEENVIVVKMSEP